MNIPNSKGKSTVSGYDLYTVRYLLRTTLVKEQGKLLKKYFTTPQENQAERAQIDTLLTEISGHLNSYETFAHYENMTALLNRYGISY